MSKWEKNTIIVVAYPDRGAGNDPKLFSFFLLGVGSLSPPRLSIFTVGNMGVVICLGQGGLRSLSASSFYVGRTKICYVSCLQLLLERPGISGYFSIKVHGSVGSGSPHIHGCRYRSSLFSASACTYGSAPECVFPCNCEDTNEVCDKDSGECQSGCKDGPPTGQGFQWSGPGCRIGEWRTFHCKDGPSAGQGFQWSGPGCRIGEWIIFHWK